MRHFKLGGGVNSYITDNVTGKFKTVSGICTPTSVKEIIELVHSARASKKAIYPYSKGLNWGYGSRSPVSDNCLLVDMSKMNKILNEKNISIDNPIALIEPGVTQIQLFNFLETNIPSLRFNVTGSGKDTSIIGNALDRGIGYFGPKKDDLFALEIVTGTGEVIKTGFRRLGGSSPIMYNRSSGIGPDLEGLFFQSNFGIVTSACFRLRPKHSREITLSLSLKSENFLPQFIDELMALKREGLIANQIHVANRTRSQSSLAFGISDYLKKNYRISTEDHEKELKRIIDLIAPGEWTLLMSLTGNQLQIKATLHEIKRRIGSFGSFRVITNKALKTCFKIANSLRFITAMRTYAAAIYAIQPLHELALGKPTDIPAQNLIWKFGHTSTRVDDLDRSKCGLLFISPVLPSNGKFIFKTLNEFRSIAQRHGYILYITLSIESDSSLIAIMNILFDRTTPGAINQAHDCADSLLDYIHQNKLSVYRVPAYAMQKTIEQDIDYWKKIFEIKKVFDPDNIIAPGRYNFEA